MLTQTTLDLINKVQVEDAQLTKINVTVYDTESPYLQVRSTDESTIKRIADLLNIKSYKYDYSDEFLICLSFVDYNNANIVANAIVADLKKFPTVLVIKEINPN